MTDTRVLVTGGSGFVAGWCIAQLLDQGYAVRTTLRDTSRAEELRQAIGTAARSTEGLEFVTADLASNAGWDAAMAGCTYVLHVASPLGGRGESESALIEAAVSGTERVLAAATRAGVARIVMTSSCAAATPRDTTGDTSSGEEVWTDLSGPELTPYRRSKALSEQAAWDWMKTHSDPARLVTVLPAAVFGPVLSRKNLGSAGLIQGLLNGRPPAIPRVSFNVIDVRDLAALHLIAMTAPQAAGQRYIAAGEVMWMADVARTLRDGLGRDAAKVPTRAMPDWLVRLGAHFIAPMRQLRPMLGRRHSFSSEKARAAFGFVPRPARDTILDCGTSLI